MTLGYLHLSEYEFILGLLCQSLENETDIEAKRNAANSIGLVFERVTDVESTFLLTSR